MPRRNFNAKRRQAKPLGETVKLASILNRTIASGKSTQVEMAAVERQVSRNIGKSLRSVSALALSNLELSEIVRKVSTTTNDGYTQLVSSNGRVSINELEQLITIDDEIVLCLNSLDDSDVKKHLFEICSTLNSLLQRRKELTTT